MVFNVDPDRLWGSLMEMGDVGREGEGVNRLALNDGDRKGRDLFVNHLRD